MNTLYILLAIIVVLLVGSILLQPGENGMFGGGVMGGGENFHTRRGLEKILFYLSFVWIALFVILSILLVRAHG